VLNQRPELFRAARRAGGVLDMPPLSEISPSARTGLPTMDRARTREEFKSICGAYFRCTIFRAGVKYPATLITTADHDDRVVPGHSCKYAAALQSGGQPANPVLIRIDNELPATGPQHYENPGADRRYLLVSFLQSRRDAAVSTNYQTGGSNAILRARTMSAVSTRITIEPGKRGGTRASEGSVSPLGCSGLARRRHDQRTILDEHPDLEKADFPAVYQFTKAEPRA